LLTLISSLQDVEFIHFTAQQSSKESSAVAREVASAFLSTRLHDWSEVKTGEDSVLHPTLVVCEEHKLPKILEEKDEEQRCTETQNSVNAEDQVAPFLKMPPTSEDQVREWMGANGFEKHSASFVANMIDGESLLELTDNDLRDDFGMASKYLRSALLKKRDQAFGISRTSSGSSSSSLLLPSPCSSPGGLDVDEKDVEIASLQARVADLELQLKASSHHQLANCYHWSASPLSSIGKCAPPQRNTFTNGGVVLIKDLPPLLSAIPTPFPWVAHSPCVLPGRWRRALILWKSFYGRFFSSFAISWKGPFTYRSLF